MSNLVKFSNIILMSILSFIGIYLLKITLNKTIPTASNTETLLQAMPYLIFKVKFWLAIFCYGTAMVVYLFLLQANPAGKIFSIVVGVNILLTTVGATLFLGEPIDGIQAIGICLVVIGIFLINGFHPCK